MTDLFLDHQARFERQQLEAAQRREQALQEQCSPVNTAEQRVRIWERLHQVRMPKDPAHAILAVIARQTSLQLTDVQEVQRSRVAPQA
jgi:hypothetical protein